MYCLLEIHLERIQSADLSSSGKKMGAFRVQPSSGLFITAPAQGSVTTRGWPRPACSRVADRALPPAPPGSGVGLSSFLVAAGHTSLLSFENTAGRPVHARAMHACLVPTLTVPAVCFLALLPGKGSGAVAAALSWAYGALF